MYKRCIMNAQGSLTLGDYVEGEVEVTSINIRTPVSSVFCYCAPEVDIIEFMRMTRERKRDEFQRKAAHNGNEPAEFSALYCERLVDGRLERQEVPIETIVRDGRQCIELVGYWPFFYAAAATLINGQPSVDHTVEGLPLIKKAFDEIFRSCGVKSRATLAEFKDYWTGKEIAHLEVAPFIFGAQQLFEGPFRQEHLATVMSDIAHTMATTLWDNSYMGTIGQVPYSTLLRTVRRQGNSYKLVGIEDCRLGEQISVIAVAACTGLKDTRGVLD